MSILSGYKKFKKYIKTSSGFQLQSLWSNANTVEADDGKNMETKVGAINGITSSTTANSTDIAASANLVNTRCNELSNNLEATDNKFGGCTLEQEGNDFYITGADSVRKKLGEPIFKKVSNVNPSSTSIPGYCKFDTGIKGKVLWQSIFIVPMIIPASGSANNNLYNGGSITYNADTGVITVNALYVKIVADIYYIVDYSLGNFSTKGMSGTLETVATKDRTTMSRNYVFNATSECRGVMLKMHSPANGASGGSIQVFGTKTGTNVYEKIDTVTAVDTDTLVPFSGYDHIKLVVTARHSGNGGHSYEAGTVTTYTFV